MPERNRLRSAMQVPLGGTVAVWWLWLLLYLASDFLLIGRVQYDLRPTSQPASGDDTLYCITWIHTFAWVVFAVWFGWKPVRSRARPEGAESKGA